MNGNTITINHPPIVGNTYSGQFYTIVGTGGYTMVQGLPTIVLASQNPLFQYDVTNAVQVLFDVRKFNKKLGLIKDASNINVIDTSYNYNPNSNRFVNDSITISASDFVNDLSASRVLSVGAYSTLYSDFNTYVNTYFGYAGGFASLFASVSTFDINGGVFDASAFVNIINGKTIDASGAYINDLSGSITIRNINNLLQYAVSTNIFANRDPSNGTTASDSTNRANYRVQDGFEAGDLIFIPSGTNITLNLVISNQGVPTYNSNHPSSTDVNNLSANQLTNFTQRYGNILYTETTSASLTGISRTVTAPLLFVLANLTK
jgi:hypothetical protein